MLLGDVINYGKAPARKPKRSSGDTDCPLVLENPLDLLPYAVQARFNSYDRRHDPTCLPDKQAEIIREIMTWADG